MPQISVVTSLYRAAPFIEEFYERARTALTQIPGEHEFVFVDDGSPDDGREIVLRLIDQDPRVRLVELSRNFGQHRAIWAGLREARGERVFMLDADLEEDPGLVVPFYNKMQEQPGTIDVVYGVMQTRKGDTEERIGGKLFYWAINRLSDTPIPSNVMNARLMTRDYVDRLLEFGDVEPFLGGLMALNGFHQVAMPCEKTSKGASSYTFRKRLRLALDAMFALTTKPLHWIFWLGAWIAAVGLAGIVGAIAGEGRAAEMALASIWLMGGLILSAIGVVGAYLGRVLTQVRGRPVAIVRKIHEASRR